jgi:hypothetical protein
MPAGIARVQEEPAKAQETESIPNSNGNGIIRSRAKSPKVHPAAKTVATTYSPSCEIDSFAALPSSASSAFPR